MSLFRIRRSVAVIAIVVTAALISGSLSASAVELSGPQSFSVSSEPPADNRAPQAGTVRLYACGIVCPYTYSRNPLLIVVGIDPDEDSMTLSIQVRKNLDGSGAVTATSTTTVSSGTEAAVSIAPAETGLPDGSYAALVQATDSWGQVGPWSAAYGFVIDSVRPPAPVVSLAGPGTPRAFSNVSMVGDTPWDSTIVIPVSADLYGYIYALTPLPVDWPPTGMVCGQHSSYYYFVCPSSFDQPIRFSVAGQSITTNIAAWTLDRAGNISEMSTASFNATSSPRPKLGHQWLSDSAPVDDSGAPTPACSETTQLADTTAGTVRRPLNFIGGACWRATPTPLRGSSPVVLDFPVVGAVATAAADPTIDTAKSFSVTAWVRPAASSSGNRTIVSQSAASGAASATDLSVFEVELDDQNRLKFCVVTSPSASVECVRGETAAPEVWMFVTAVYDEINRQLVIYGSSTGTGGYPQRINLVGTVPTATGGLVLANNHASTEQFIGQIYHPAVMPGVIDSGRQLSELGYDRLPLTDISGGDPAAILTQPPGLMLGTLDTARQAPGGIRTVGWTIDTDTAAPTDVHVYFNGTGFDLGPTDSPRPDVAAAFAGYGAGHGFDRWVPYTGGNGIKQVCEFGINAKDAGSNPLLRCVDVGFSNDTTGSLDTAIWTTSGQLSVSGWAFDGNVGTPITVQISFDGTVVSTIPSADLTRPDVAKVYPDYGAAHGYSVTVPQTLTPGVHTVCAVGVNSGGTPGASSVLGCRTVTVRTQPAGQMFGTLDVARQVPGGIQIAGWTLDTDTPAPTGVHVYVDGSTGFDLGTTDVDRPDIAAAFPGYGSQHGVNEIVPYVGTNGTKQVCEFGINAAGPGGNQLLRCADIGFTNDTFGALDSVIREGRGLRVSGWAIDPNVSAPIDTYLTVNGAVSFDLYAADGSRPDVAAVYPDYGPSHGFDASAPVLLPSPLTVCVVAKNADGTLGADTIVGCRTI